MIWVVPGQRIYFLFCAAPPKLLSAPQNPCTHILPDEQFHCASAAPSETHQKLCLLSFSRPASRDCSVFCGSLTSLRVLIVSMQGCPPTTGRLCRSCLAPPPVRPTNRIRKSLESYPIFSLNLAPREEARATITFRNSSVNRARETLSRPQTRSSEPLWGVGERMESDDDESYRSGRVVAVRSTRIIGGWWRRRRMDGRERTEKRAGWRFICKSGGTQKEEEACSRQYIVLLIWVLKKPGLL